jgi:hypothetical protein
VEAFFTYEVYPNYIKNDKLFFQERYSLDRFYNVRHKDVDDEEAYSAIVIDLLEGRYMPYHPIDTSKPFPFYAYNQRWRFDALDQTHPDDTVFDLGINLRYIKERITPRRRFSSWKDDMENRLPGEEVKELFEQFESKDNVQWK